METPRATHHLNLVLLEMRLAVCRLPPSWVIPEWATVGELLSITRTPDELSIVCDESLVPQDVHAEAGRRVFRVSGAMDLSIVGVLASLTAPLAEAGISLFAISTFDTDYLLIKEKQLEQAIAALTHYGHTIHVPE